MRLILNLLWFILGGWISGTLWLLAGIVLAITIVGLPWAQAAFRVASFTYWPFGREVVDRATLTGQHDLGTGDTGLILNVIWFAIAGWWLAFHHLVIAFALFVSIIGIPFGIQHLKLAIISLAPVGKTVIST